MCVTCEGMLFEDHRAAESDFDPCPKCGKFPADSSGNACYHCFALGNTIDECAECEGKPWSEDFQEIRREIEAEDGPAERVH